MSRCLQDFSDMHFDRSGTGSSAGKQSRRRARCISAFYFIKVSCLCHLFCSSSIHNSAHFASEIRNPHQKQCAPQVADLGSGDENTLDHCQ
jgi:hypothetical protein